MLVSPWRWQMETVLYYDKMFQDPESFPTRLLCRPSDTRLILSHSWYSPLFSDDSKPGRRSPLSGLLLTRARVPGRRSSVAPHRPGHQDMWHRVQTKLEPSWNLFLETYRKDFKSVHYSNHWQFPHLCPIILNRSWDGFSISLAVVAAMCRVSAPAPSPRPAPVLWHLLAPGWGRTWLWPGASVTNSAWHCVTLSRAETMQPIMGGGGGPGFPRDPLLSVAVGIMK